MIENPLTCENPYYAAVLGGIVAVTPLQNFFNPPLPPAVHWAVAGAAGEYYCTRSTDPNTLAGAAFYGWAGGMGTRAVLSFLM